MWTGFNQTSHNLCPLSIRAFDDEAKARLGLVECAKHELLQPFSVLHEKEGKSSPLPFSCFFFFFLAAFTYKLTPSLLLCLLSGEYVAQFKFTVLLMANGPHRITNGPFDPELYKSEHEVQDPELKVKTLFTWPTQSAFVTQKSVALNIWSNNY